MTKFFIFLTLFLMATKIGQSANPALVRAVDLNIGESQRVVLCNGRKVDVRLLSVKEVRDDVISAVRAVKTQAEINGRPVSLACAMYNLPVTIAGVRIDCPITKNYLRDTAADQWGLIKDARLRLWPASSPLMAPGTFVYPIKQRWFASDTQMANEPVFVDRGECPSPRKVYYHSGLDFGGAEGLIDVLSATDGLVVSAGIDALPEHKQDCVNPRYDVVNVLDHRGWYYRYSHLHKIESSIRPGAGIKMGQKLGVLGKEGGSGGWSHLHFAISSMQPSGLWGVQEAYAFVWEAYRRQYTPKLVAVARPHQVAWAGQTVVLDGKRSWSSSGKIVGYDWIFTDGSTASGETVKKKYPKPGTCSEILKVTDSTGQVSYDFAVVQVMDKAHPDWCIPTIHAVYAPTMGIKPGDPVTFKVRTFGTTSGSEKWDFGDGTPPVIVKSDGNVKPLNPEGYATTQHVYKQPGDYLVRVHRTDEHGFTATARLFVPVRK
ncbi:MAG: PKD domain-containing protein [Planctomycetota bacterium]|jgi:murein DD-endopeptidase MepM/ murein hydrolase activator NlpD